MIKKIGALLVTGLIMAGCSTVTEKASGKLCTGTKRPYQVKGTWYEPQEHYDYDEVGVASWYGPRFHGQPKSCGETFNMHGISAAHKTLPIPSVVRVTNMQTGKDVKLLVDDRGPFPKGRLIDLSKGAAIHLGIHDKGLGEVRVQCLPQDSKAFARFVSQYGRYGRDPSGRTWEEIFREHFDKGECTPLPKQSYTQSRPRLLVKKRVSTQRPLVKPTPISYQLRNKNKAALRIRKNLSSEDMPAY
jgi:rare lipoprotein A